MRLSAAVAAADAADAAVVSVITPRSRFRPPALPRLSSRSRCQRCREVFAVARHAAARPIDCGAAALCPYSGGSRTALASVSVWPVFLLVVARTLMGARLSLAHVSLFSGGTLVTVHCVNTLKPTNIHPERFLKAFERLVFPTA